MVTTMLQQPATTPIAADYILQLLHLIFLVFYGLCCRIACSSVVAVSELITLCNYTSVLVQQSFGGAQCLLVYLFVYLLHVYF